MVDYVKPPQNRPVLVSNPNARRDVVPEDEGADEAPVTRRAADGQKAPGAPADRSARRGESGEARDVSPTRPSN
ncbi:hypothetical protein GFK26_00590 [Variovorax paradoxus]|uniref:Uncharacterized protein n=1 Tax=Variovorax paradoxus TaxID=34073 RepID=A0A5Q0LVN7_VARPD|nr:hypothetical protein [Variovorax paradoxus]QFZ81381.1 hypothetical protein GFK26_00590 [Variovorax paradoxus]